MATSQGTAAIAVIRVSGKDAFNICKKLCFNKAGRDFDFEKTQANSIHFCILKEKDKIVDEAMVAVFKAPRSYSGENSVEIYCHGSVFIQQRVIQLILSLGARMANPGEFTLRAFLNGKIDLAQADAVADLIASNSESSHKVAMQQMRGGYSGDLKQLRDQLIQFASLIELELDFSEEDVSFADRDKFLDHLNIIDVSVNKLIRSFAFGNAIKNGIPVAIVGKPNSGKSTLLNTLFNEERAIVSDIAGTTRDTIEEELIINGVKFRFIDTAGLRETVDTIESLGVTRTILKMQQASVVIYLFDVHEITPSELRSMVNETIAHIDSPATKLILVGNKIDKENSERIKKEFENFPEKITFISAREKQHISDITMQLSALFNEDKLNSGESVVTNVRHLDALQKASSALMKVKDGIENNLSRELLTSDIREALYYIGIITGEVSTEDLLQSIFSRFCIGK